VTNHFGHRLPPFLGEPFGGCAGLVDVGVERESFDEAIPSRPDCGEAKLDGAAAAPGSCSLEEDAEGRAAEVAELLDHLVKVLVGAEPILIEAAYRLMTSKMPIPIGDISQIPSGLNTARAPSKSRRLKASTPRRTASSRSGVVDSSGIMREVVMLPPFLG
jgi:hypothetical protein